MDYICIYKKIIEKARSLESQRLNDGVYVECHHIVPRCMGGLDVSSNLVYLTAREHFICHWLLFKQYRTTDLAHAFFSMINGPLVKNGKRDLKPSSLAFASAREAQSWSNRIQSKRYHEKIVHNDPIVWDNLPKDWRPLIIKPSLKNTCVLINTKTGVIKRHSCDDVKQLVESGDWKHINKGKRKIYRKSNPKDTLMVTMDHPLLQDRDWEFSQFTSCDSICYVVENSQHYRWLINRLSDVPEGYRLISARYTNIADRSTCNMYMDDPLVQDQTMYINTNVKWVSLTNKITGETRKVYVCEKEYRDPNWEAMKSNKGKKLVIDDKGNRRLVKSENIPDGWLPITNSTHKVRCVNKKGETKLLALEQPIDVDEWSLASTNKQMQAKVRKYAIECNLELLTKINAPIKQPKREDGVYLKNVNTGETAFIRYDDPKYHDPNWRGSKVGRLNIRNQLTGELRVVDVDDPIRQDPNWQPLGYKKATYRNVETGDVLYLSVDDPLLATGKWVSTSKGWSTFKNVVTREVASYGKDDPRRQDPNWQSIYKGCNDHVPDKVCPHCGTVCKHGKGYTRWHGENCRHKPK